MDLRKIGIALIFIGIVLTVVFVNDERIFVPALTVTVLGFFVTVVGFVTEIIKRKEINDQLEMRLNERLAMAGMEIVEARINYLAYAPEIAAVMLRRQQASAIITAREKIVEGAVSMVKMALDKLSAEDIVELDEDKKAAMVSNLLVVLCADEPAQPVINSGTLNH